MRGWRGAALVGVAATSVLTAMVGQGTAGPAEPATGPLVTDSAVLEYVLSPDSRHVVYLASTAGVDELYSVPIDGGSAPTKLNGPLPNGGRVVGERSFAISPDGRRVVYLADQDRRGVFDLYSVPIDGSDAPTKLNGSLTRGRTLGHPVISPDGNRVVYGADQDRFDVFELYSVPIDGTGAPTRLNGPLPAGGDVSNFVVSPDGGRVVYLADQDTNDVLELYAVATRGGTPVRISGPMTDGGAVAWDFEISPDSERVVYAADQDTDEVYELYSVPIDGSGTSTKLNGSLVAGGDVPAGDPASRRFRAQRSFEIAPDGSRVVYRADQDTDGVFELYSRPIDGSGTPTRLSGPLPAGGDVPEWVGIEITPDSSHVVYVADQGADEVFELYSVPIDGSSAPITLNPPLAAGRDVGAEYAITPDASRVVYRSDQVTNDAFELFARPIDGSGTSIRLNGPLVAGGDVGFMVITPDGRRVVYSADQDTDEVYELYSVSITGGGAPAKLSRRSGIGDGRTSFINFWNVTADSRWTVYLAGDELVPGVIELVAAPTAPEPGYWLLETDGDLVPFGGASALPSAVPDMAPGATAVALAAHPDGKGAWILTSDGDIIARGSATDFGRVDLTLLTRPGERVVELSPTPHGHGLWVFTTAGRILDFGTAPPADQVTGGGTVLDLDLDGAIIGAVATSTGTGAHLVAADGGVFAIGDATFVDSVRGTLTRQHGRPGLPHHPVVGLTSDPDGHGYWIVAADGGVFGLGAPFRGSLPQIVPFERLGAPIVGMVPYGDGYLLVATDGGVFTFSDLPFQGSAFGTTDSPVVDIATVG